MIFPTRFPVFLFFKHSSENLREQHVLTMVIQLRAASSTGQRDLKNNSCSHCPTPSPLNFSQTSACF